MTFEDRPSEDVEDIEDRTSEAGLRSEVDGASPAAGQAGADAPNAAQPDHGVQPPDMEPQDFPEQSSSRRRRPLRRVAAWYRRQPRWRRRTLTAMAALLTAMATLVCGIGAALYVEGAGTPSAAAHSTGNDALWLGHAWVGWPVGTGRAAKTDADFQALAAQVRSSGIKDLFVHDGPFEMDGSLDPAKSPNAEWFVDAVHRELPGVRVQAWLGQVVGGDALHLDDAATRARVVSGVNAVLERGFAGVHFDFEPVPDGDTGLVAVTAAAHTVTSSHHALLSVSVPQVEPLSGWRVPGNFLAGHPKWWSQGYLRSVAGHCDQVAVMAYDTSLPTAWAYRGYVARQTEVALSAIPPNVELLMGVPAFHTHDPGHWDFAETMPAALTGIRLALGAHPPARLFGVALYVDFAATPGDWEAYHADWFSPAGAA